MPHLVRHCREAAQAHELRDIDADCAGAGERQEGERGHVPVVVEDPVVADVAIQERPQQQQCPGLQPRFLPLSAYLRAGVVEIFTDCRARYANIRIACALLAATCDPCDRSVSGQEDTLQGVPAGSLLWSTATQQCAALSAAC